MFVTSFHSCDRLVEPQFQLEMLGSFAVVLQRVYACRLLGGAGHWDFAYFEKLRRREKHHVDWIMVKRITKTTFVDNERAQPRAFDFNGARETSWAGADTYYVVTFSHEFSFL